MRHLFEKTLLQYHIANKISEILLVALSRYSLIFNDPLEIGPAHTSTLYANTNNQKRKKFYGKCNCNVNVTLGPKIL